MLRFCEKREYNSQSRAAHNGNTRRLMVARGALCSAVDCQIIDNIPKPTRSCASAQHRARAIRIEAERNRKRRLLPWRDPQQRNTTIDTLLAFSHSCAPTRTFIEPQPAHLRMPLHRRVGQRAQARPKLTRAAQTLRKVFF